MDKHTPGPWRWEFNASSKTVHLVGGKPQFDKTVMDFTRWGMSGAQPRFMGIDGPFLLLHKLTERPEWVAPFPGRDHHAHWCAQVTHPDARLMAAAPDLLEALTRLIIRCDEELADPEDVSDLQWAKQVARKARGEA